MGARQHRERLGRAEQPARVARSSSFVATLPPCCSTGPTGKVLLLPEPNKPLIMVATGTGIAPFRSFWRRIFYEDVPGYKVRRSRAHVASAPGAAGCLGRQTRLAVLITMLCDAPPPRVQFTGLFWLFMGVANSDSKLYDDELSAIAVRVRGVVRVVRVCGVRRGPRRQEGMWNDGRLTCRGTVVLLCAEEAPGAVPPGLRAVARAVQP